jgi:hypothetical protein
MLHVDDKVRLDAHRAFLNNESPPDVQAMGEQARRLTRMLVGSMVGEVIDKAASVQQGVDYLWKHPQIRAELLELFDLLADRVDHVHHSLTGHPEVPLRVHAKYTRVEILAAMGVGATARVRQWITGCERVEAENADVFAFTLDKTTGQFSPSTRYRDYAISRDLLHWESQSVTREASTTGQRYINHQRLGSTILLFGRLRSDERAFWFLGPGTYVKHQGEMPIAITWRLHHPLPGDLYERFAAAVA